jgi:hypothetical protein
MHQHNLLETLVSLGVADDAHEGRKTRAGGKQIEPRARREIVEHQRANRLLADQDAVAFADMLQARGQRAIGHLDGEELQLVLIIGRDHGVGAQERLSLHLKPDHGELPVQEAE